MSKTGRPYLVYFGVRGTTLSPLLLEPSVTARGTIGAVYEKPTIQIGTAAAYNDERFYRGR
jgi:hypothetical protein